MFTSLDKTGRDDNRRVMSLNDVVPEKRKIVSRAKGITNGRINISER